MSPSLAVNGKAMHIYVAGPYSADNTRSVEQNVSNAIVAGVEILRKGHYPYIPHLTHYVDKEKKKSLNLSWEDHLDWGLAWLDKCDAILFLATSRGASIELDYAKGKGLRVFRTIHDVPELPGRRRYVDSVVGRVDEESP